MHRRRLWDHGQERDFRTKILGDFARESHRIVNISATTCANQDPLDGRPQYRNHQHGRSNRLGDRIGFGRRQEKLLGASAFRSDDDQIIDRLLGVLNDFRNRVAEFGNDLEVNFLFPEYLLIPRATSPAVSDRPARFR